MGFYDSEVYTLQMIRDYVEISRLFNMGLTGVAPVLGALSMWNVNETSLLNIIILFCIGCFSHVYGFVINDIVDVKIDKLSKELLARPLVSGHITVKKALIFALVCMSITFLLSLFFYKDISSYLVLLGILALGYLFATIYDITGKKYPCMDMFVVGAVFLGIMFGAMTIGTPTTLSWIIALIGAIQVLFMNMINGAIKDIDHDADGKANTLAIRLGAKIHKHTIALPLAFKTVGYLMELARIVLIFIPFVFLSLFYDVWQIALLILLEILTLVSIYKLLSVKKFERDIIRKNIGIIVIFMYATAPVMLSSINSYILLLALVPPLWFFFSNILLHRTIFEPKTM